MDEKTVTNEETQTVLTPVAEFLAVIEQRYKWNPNSLAAGGYREVLRMGEDFIHAERKFMNAAFTAGYEKAFEDLKNHKPENEVNKGGEQ